MTHIFLSYSREDASVMRQLQEQLQKEGLKTWTDESLTPGTPSWKDAIERAIEGAQCLVVLLSPSARESRWVKSEIDFAEKQGVKVFTVLVGGDEKSAIPFGLTTSQWIDLRSRANFESEVKKLANAIRRHLGLPVDGFVLPTSGGVSQSWYLYAAGGLAVLLMAVIAVVVLMGDGDDEINSTPVADVRLDETQQIETMIILTAESIAQPSQEKLNADISASATALELERRSQSLQIQQSTVTFAIASLTPVFVATFTPEPILCTVPVREDIGEDAAKIRNLPGADGTVMTHLKPGDLVEVYTFQVVDGSLWLEVESVEFLARWWISVEHVEASECGFD